MCLALRGPLWGCLKGKAKGSPPIVEAFTVRPKGNSRQTDGIAMRQSRRTMPMQPTRETTFFLLGGGLLPFLVPGAKPDRGSGTCSFGWGDATHSLRIVSCPRETRMIPGFTDETPRSANGRRNKTGWHLAEGFPW